jgi:nicotinamidase-related amidase
MKQALLIVDIQNDYFPGGKFELFEMEGAAKNAQRLLQSFQDQQAPIVHIQHIALQADAPFFLPDTQGAEIHSSVSPESNGFTIVKHFPNSFRETKLLQHLKALEIKEVVICGAMSHMCIDATVRAAVDFGFQCVVVEDACAARDLEYQGHIVKAVEVQTAFMAALAMMYAKVIPIDEFLMHCKSPVK